MNEELAVLFAKRFIQRRDVKAVQFASGAYVPDFQLKTLGMHGPLGFQMNHLYAHLDGTASYGHYLLDAESNCRMFAFDIDLEKEGFWSSVEAVDQAPPAAPMNPREAWSDRAHPGRPWMKMQMGMLARKFVSAIQKELGIPCAAAYSGNKGIHVYGFTGPMPAIQVRAAATFVIESTDDWTLTKGNHLYRHKLRDPDMGYPNFSVEVFPKQDTVSDDGGLGNLMRLPLGRNLKSVDPTFFLDLTTPPGVMAPHANPVQLLDSGNPYE